MIEYNALKQKCAYFSMGYALLFVLCIADTVMATASGTNDEAEAAQDDCMGPPSMAGTSAEASQATEQSETEGEDGVSIYLLLIATNFNDLFDTLGYI